TSGITVNCISPGYVWTPLVENQIPDTMNARNMTREQVMNDVLLAAQPTKRFVTPEEVAALALYLCRDEARSITGANLSIEGALLEPDAALGGPISNGAYRCRVIKLGAKAPGNLAYVSYPAFTCRIQAERALQRLTKFGGSQRYVGLVFPNDALRQVFLGTL